MNSLKVPESGLLLEGSAGKDSSLPPQAFALTLSDNVIEDMIRCFKNNEDIQLALGPKPTFYYGSHSHTVAPPSENYPLDLYLTKPFESTRKAEKLSHASTLFEKVSSQKTSAKSQASKVDDNATTTKSKSMKSNKSTTSSGLDSDIETLQNGLAAHAASREKARMVDKLPAKKGASKTKGKLLPGYGSTPRSIPASPGPASAASPSTPVLSASQQHMERAKEQRVTFVHELAVQDRTIEYLTKKWSGKAEDLRPTLEKVADQLPDKKWAMRKTYWKELDVWKYDYDTQELRQMAIDNAIRQYDKQRLSESDPMWQRLLPREERGKGKCLSRLQANLAKGPAQPPPKIKVQKADDGSSPKDESESLDGDRPNGSGEPMSRSASNPLTKIKKPSAQDAQVKRLLSNSKAKTTKTSPTKARPAANKPNGGRVLSKEFIENSDSSGDEAPAKAPPKPASRPVAKESVTAKPRPVAKEPIKKQQPTKRPRDDSDSSSSSEMPLSKRIKPKQPPLAAAPRLKHRPSDASQNSRGTGTSSSMKSKNTSPAKSSPLASSPPTNASDLENEESAIRPVLAKKRKLDEQQGSGPASKRATSVSDALARKAHKFKVCYEQYEALHYELSALDNPPSQKVGDLWEMRERLKTMKKEIYRECPPGRA